MQSKATYKDSYRFFIDESMHDSNLTLNNMLINISNKHHSSYFTLAGIGNKKENTTKLLNEYNTLENRYKKLIGIRADAEFKAKTIKSKNFTYGFKSMEDKFVRFYYELFDLLNRENTIVHLSTISKFELVIHSVFAENYNEWIKSNNFRKTMNTVIKFLHDNVTEELLEVLFDSNSKPLDFHEKVNMISKEIEVNSGDSEIDRLYGQMSDYIILLLLLAIKKQDFREDYKWNYIYSLIGLYKLLENLNADILGTEIFIDGGGHRTETILSSAKFLFNKSSVQVINSEYSEGIRIADMVSNFFARIIRSMENNYNQLSYKDKFLNISWFELDELRFKTYKNIGKYLLKMRHINSTTYTGLYSDIPVRMYSLFDFFTRFEDYESYRATNISDRPYMVESIALMKENNMYK